KDLRPGSSCPASLPLMCLEHPSRIPPFYFVFSSLNVLCTLCAESPPRWVLCGKWLLLFLLPVASFLRASVVSTAFPVRIRPRLFEDEQRGSVHRLLSDLQCCT